MSRINPSLAYRVKYFLWGDGRWAEQSWWRRAWVTAWGWVFDTLWESWLRPHVTPRRWERGLHQLHEHMRIPSRVNAFLMKQDDGSYVVHLIEDGGPWDLCCLQADDLASAKTEAMDQLHYWKAEAGSWSREGRLVVMWHERSPTTLDRTYTA